MPVSSCTAAKSVRAAPPVSGTRPPLEFPASVVHDEGAARWSRGRSTGGRHGPCEGRKEGRKEGTSTHEKPFPNPEDGRRDPEPDRGERIAAIFVGVLVLGGPLVTAAVTVARAAMRVVARESVMVATRSNVWSGDTGARCDWLDEDTGVDWPYDAAELTLVYADTGYARGLWDMVDAPATVSAVNGVGAGIWAARLPALAREKHRGNGSCYWASWAAVDDVLERNRTPTLAGNVADFDTMGLVGTPGAKKLRRLQPCHVRWLAERVRREADEHDDAGPGIVRGVLLDEPWKLLDTPDTWLWQPVESCPWTSLNQSVASWTKDDFAEMAAQFQTGTYAIPTADHSACAPDPGSPPSDCPTDSTAATIDGSDVEVWFRVLDAAMPRLILPSLVLGMPADPDHRPAPEGRWTPSLYCSDVYGFCEGDEVTAWWWGLVDPGSALTDKVVLEYFYVVSDDDLPLDLTARVNGTVVTPMVYDDASSTWTAVSESVADTSVYQVVQRRYCIGGVGCGGGPWNVGGVNTIGLKLAPTNLTPGSTDSTEPFTDRLVYVWGVRVRVLSGGGEEVAELSLPPEDATTNFVDAHGGNGPFLATDNADWLVADQADAVVIAMNNSLGLSDDLGDMGRSGKPMFFSPHAYRAFVRDACDDLGATPCLVEVRGSDSSAMIDDAVTEGGTDYPRAPLWAWKARMEAADDFADGILAMGLPLDDANAGTEAGRWAWKGVACTGPDDADCTLGNGNTVRLVEQRNTVLFAGAHEEFDARLVDTASVCEDWYTIDVNVSAPADTPQLHWWIYTRGGAGAEYVDDGHATADDTLSSSAQLASGDTLRLYWVSEGGGAAPVSSNRVTFTVTPPDPSCDLDWSHTSSVDTGYREWDDTTVPPSMGWHVFATTPREIDDCITGYWSGTTGVCP